MKVPGVARPGVGLVAINCGAPESEVAYFSVVSVTAAAVVSVAMVALAL